MATEVLTWPAEPTLTDNSDGGQNYNMGIRFSVTEEVDCVGVQWRVPDSVSAPIGGNHVVSVWDETPLQLARASFTPSVGGYQNVLFAGPLTLSPGVNYTAAVYTVHYVFRASGGVWPTSPSGIAVADRGQLNAYSGGPDNVPGSGAFGTSTALFYVSPILDLGGGLPSVSPTGIAVGVALGSPSTSPLGVTPSGLSVPVSLGSPRVQGAAAPTGIAVPVTVGSPTVVGVAPAPVARARGWETFRSSLRYNAEQERLAVETPPVDCPVCGERLENTTRGLHCPAGDYTRP